MSNRANYTILKYGHTNITLFLDQLHLNNRVMCNK